MSVFFFFVCDMYSVGAMKVHALFHEHMQFVFVVHGLVDRWIEKERRGEKGV